MRSKLVHIKENGKIEEDDQGTHVLLSIEDYERLIKVLEEISGFDRYPKNIKMTLNLYYPPKEN
jgi:hypothetical protein